MSEFSTLSHHEQIQYLDQEQLNSAIAVQETTGVDNSDEINNRQETIRQEAVASEAYYTSLRRALIDPSSRPSALQREIDTAPDPDSLPDDQKAAALEHRERLARADARTREIIRDINDPAIPTEFPRPAADQNRIPRDYDTMAALEQTYVAGLSPSAQAIEAARKHVDQLRLERTLGARRIKDFSKMRPATEADAVAANRELWDAEDRLDILADDDGYERIADKRVRELDEAFKRDPSDTNRMLLHEARRRAATISSRRDEQYEEKFGQLLDTNEPHRHALERTKMHEGHAKKTDEAYDKALAHRDSLQQEVEKLRRQHAFNPGSFELAQAEDKLQRAQDALDIATNNRNENRESADVSRRIFNGLPGLVTRERIERRLGTLRDHEANFINAIDIYVGAERANARANHEVFTATQALHQYVREIDTELAQMKPEHMNYAEVLKMRAEAMRSLVRCTFVAEHVKIQDASMNNDRFEGRYQSQRLQDGSRGIIIERSNGHMAIYADGSFARYDHAGKLGLRMNPDGSHWKPKQPAQELFGDFADDIATAQRYTSNDEATRNAQRRIMSPGEISDLDGSVSIAWLFNQDNPQVAEVALAMNRDMYSDNVSRFNRTPPSDMTERLQLIAENNSLEYEARVIDHVSLNNEHSKKQDRLGPRGQMMHKGKHYNIDGNWIMYPDGSLAAYSVDSNNRITVTRWFNPQGQNVPI